MRTTAIVVAAGRGVRFKSKEKKPFAKLLRKPVLSYALTTFQRFPLIDDIILVVDRPLIKKAERLVKNYRINKVSYVVAGGKVRSESVRNGLRRVKENASLVLIHDGVRPLINDELIKKLIAAARKYGAAISAVPVKPTIKLSKDGSFIASTPDRRYLWEAQTPQVFKKDIIENAYKRIAPHPLNFRSREGWQRGAGFTDDAALAELAGARVRIVKGDYRNIKITTIEDLKIAEALIKSV
ncbi:MAG: 2-C-methyl-D-erythritol 4-phosphate cytidylyltransferase [Candidatus Omnitrophota bacterium]|nr:2-C-methyl-D-erythritol 4-phosphate cytidylyltransferase [Candidatus Omnitrophota bacterium]